MLQSQTHTNCTIPHKAFSYKNLGQYGKETFADLFRKEELEELENLLNKKTGEARYKKKAYFDVRNDKWVDLSLCNVLNSLGTGPCDFDSIQLSTRMQFNEYKSLIAIQTVRDFVKVYGYNIPDNAGYMVENDINRVKLIKDRDSRYRKHKMKLQKKELKKEWAFLKQIYNKTTIFGIERNYNNFLDSKNQSEPIFKCMCDYHSRFNKSIY